jgi:dihydrofolate synthase/folylpolyglutamate synthase
MNFQETLEYMYKLLPMYQRVGKIAFKKDLTNTIKLLDLLGNPQHQFKSIHIAGTNGKGSSAHMLASVLQAAGYRTGLYVSPHLKRFTERIKVSSQEVDEQFVCEFIAKLQGRIEEIQPSFFEITVAMAFEYFARKQVDIAVIEVGLGGRFDSTNVIIPIISLITSISYDHMDMLGNTLTEIAFEKAGIIKPGVPVVISETQEEIVPVFTKKAEECGSLVYFADQEFTMNRGVSSQELFEFEVRRNGEISKMESDLAGLYQLKNIPGVLKVIELLDGQGFLISKDKLRSGLSQVGKSTGFKGRWQKLSDAPLIVCDTAHNEAGVQLLFEQIMQQDYQRLFVVWGMVEGKPLEGIFQHLPKEAFYYFCEPDVPRAMKAELLYEFARKMKLIGAMVKGVNDAVDLAKQQAGEKDLIFIGGSNFVVAEINDL